MQKYRYKAVNLQKETFTGTFIAENEKDLAAQLSKQSLFLVSCKPYTDKTPSVFFSTTGKVKNKEIAVFCRQFAIMINSGIPILGCLEILKTQPYTAMLRTIIDRVHEDVKGGLMLSEAIDKHKKVFPDFFRSMIKVGEISGKLDDVLTSLADYYETDGAMKKKISGALAYPCILLVMMIAVVILMMLYIVPTFRASLAQVNVEIQGLTKVVYDASDFMLANGLTILAIIIVIGLIIFFIARTKGGKMFFAKLGMKLPIIGQINTDLLTSRFARAFSLLLSSGMDIIDAMESVSIIIGNVYAQKRFKQATEDVRHGMSLTMAFDLYKIFPQMLVQMVSIGEKTATLDEVLNRSYSFFDNQVENSVTKLTSILQPVMLVIMGVIVGALFIAIYSPILDMMQNLV